MNKQEFMDELKIAIQDQAYTTVSQAITYYDEMIDDLIEDGISEEDAISQLGSIEKIALQIKNEDQIIEVKPLKKSKSLTISVLLFLGFPLWGSLVAAGVCLLLAFYIILWCIPIVTVALGISGGLYFIVGIFGSFALLNSSLALVLMQFGLSAICGAIGIMGIYSTYLLSSKILVYTKVVNKKIKDYSIEVLRKVGLVC